MKKKQKPKTVAQIKKSKKEIVNMLLHQDFEAKDEEELIDLLINNPISVDIDKEEDTNLTTGEHLADRFSEIAGSWGFIICFSVFLISWIIINAFALKNSAVDPYPFILLNLVLSCVAALQAPIIMMSQNRQAKKDSIRNQNDYRIDLKSELILEVLHHEMEKILANQNKILAYIKENDINTNTEKEKKDLQK